ncbi:MAG: right-handed parallel beta-helix repeat-containing protein [Nibricoccus sp.]
MRISASAFLFPVFLAVASFAPAATFYVAPAGDDAASGTAEKPFGSIQRAVRDVSAGDLVLVHGGKYVLTEKQIADMDRLWASVILINRSGTEKKPIRIAAVEGEQPVFDFSEVKPADRRVIGFRITGSWVQVEGLEVTGVQVTIKGHTQSVCFQNEGSHNRFERLSMHDSQAIGFWIGKGSDNMVLNCDAYRNYDFTSEGGKGGNSDGFGCHVPRGSVNNVFRSCRAWFNSDDGYDCINAHEAVTFENCWAFYNGYSPEFKSLADGNGFKAGGYGDTPAERLPKTIPRHVVRGCLAVRNKASGVYSNHHPAGVDFFNNTAWRNKRNFNLQGRMMDNKTEIAGRGHRVGNNLAFEAQAAEIVALDAEHSEVHHNSFDLPIKLSAADFLGLDEAELIKPRQKNGDLPEIKLLHLAKGSAAVDRGVDVGLPFHGKAPDLGAFEQAAP